MQISGDREERTQFFHNAPLFDQLLSLAIFVMH